MKVELTKKIEIFDVNLSNTIRPRNLMMMFQDVATAHSKKVGLGYNRLVAQHKSWVLYQMGIHIHRLPVLDDEVRIQSWHAGQDRYMAYRDYLVTCGNETLVSARGVWLMIDTSRKKLISLSDDIGKQYTVEPAIFDAESFDAWKPRLRPELTHICSIVLRPSDFDFQGHVNNVTYLEYLDILICRFMGENVTLKNVYMQYPKEIPAGTREIQAGLQQQGDRYVFKLYSDTVIHAIGDFQVA